MITSQLLRACLRVVCVESQHIVGGWVVRMHAGKGERALRISKNTLPLDAEHIHCARLQYMPSSNPACVIRDDALAVRRGNRFGLNFVSCPPFGDRDIRYSVQRRRTREGLRVRHSVGQRAALRIDVLQLVVGICHRECV